MSKISNVSLRISNVHQVASGIFCRHNLIGIHDDHSEVYPVEIFVFSQGSTGIKGDTQIKSHGTEMPE